MLEQLLKIEVPKQRDQWSGKGFISNNPLLASWAKTKPDEQNDC